MWARGRNRANPGIVPTWGRSSNNRGTGCSSSLSRTQGRTALASSRGGDGSGGGRHRSDGRARVGPVGKGMRGAAHPLMGCLNRRVREGERINPFNIHKWVVSG